MGKRIYQDREGNTSSKRITGFILMGYVLIMATLDGLDWYEVNETIIVSIIAIGAALLGLDSVTGIWKAGGSNNRGGEEHYPRNTRKDNGTHVATEPD